MASSSAGLRLSERGVKGILCDIHGVLFDNDSSTSYPVKGSVEAFNKLSESGIPIRLVSNESSCTPEDVVKKCHKLGINVEKSHIFTPVPAAYNVLRQRNLRLIKIFVSSFLLYFLGLEIYFEVLVLR